CMAAASRGRESRAACSASMATRPNSSRWWRLASRKSVSIDGGPGSGSGPQRIPGRLGGALDRQRVGRAPVPLAVFRFIAAAVVQLALVDVHRHRDGVVAAVVDGVVLVRRDQAAGAAGAGMHAAGGAEAAALAVGLEQF